MNLTNVKGRHGKKIKGKEKKNYFHKQGISL